MRYESRADHDPLKLELKVQLDQATEDMEMICDAERDRFIAQKLTAEKCRTQWANLADILDEGTNRDPIPTWYDDEGQPIAITSAEKAECYHRHLHRFDGVHEKTDLRPNERFERYIQKFRSEHKYGQYSIRRSGLVKDLNRIISEKTILSTQRPSAVRP